MPRNFSPHPRILASSHTHLARHYHPALSIWLSVDPMADKYPRVSPYTYCVNSSTRRVTIFINGKEVEASVKQIRAKMNKVL